MKFSTRAPTALTLTLAVFAGCAAMEPAPAQLADGVLVGPGGMTLYTFDKDVANSGKSACNGPCASNWPPLMAISTDHASGDYSIITRDDGARQWAVNGKPLYYWSKDSKPGDKTGDGMLKLWQTAKPAPKMSGYSAPRMGGY